MKKAKAKKPTEKPKPAAAPAPAPDFALTAAGEAEEFQLTGDQTPLEQLVIRLRQRLNKAQKAAAAAAARVEEAKAMVELAVEALKRGGK